MRAHIHRGAHEVGGSCVELEAQGQRIVLDVGLPLSATHGEEVGLPPIDGFTSLDHTLLGVFISHSHPDHYGLMPQIAESVPLFIGEVTANILSEAAFFSPMGMHREPTGFLRHREVVEVGPFRVTPFLSDHSAFDAYSLLVEADGRRLFYSGDIRSHGRKKSVFEELISNPPEEIDVLLMEGTNIREDSLGTERGLTEQNVEDLCVEIFSATNGIVLAMFSPQNIDRLVSIYRACLRSGRDLVIDLYSAAIVQATARETIPQPDWDRIRVYLPGAQRSRVIREQAFHRTDAVRPHRIYAEELKRRREDLVMIFRTSMIGELEGIGCLEGAHVLWSMWPGYLKDKSGERLTRFRENYGIPITISHASGHAYIPDLQRFADALSPIRLVPIHTFAGERFEEFFGQVERRPDGQWWEV